MSSCSLDVSHTKMFYLKSTKWNVLTTFAHARTQGRCCKLTVSKNSILSEKFSPGSTSNSAPIGIMSKDSRLDQGRSYNRLGNLASICIILCTLCLNFYQACSTLSIPSYRFCEPLHLKKVQPQCWHAFGSWGKSGSGLIAVQLIILYATDVLQPNLASLSIAISALLNLFVLFGEDALHSKWRCR